MVTRHDSEQCRRSQKPASPAWPHRSCGQHHFLKQKGSYKTLPNVWAIKCFLSSHVRYSEVGPQTRPDPNSKAVLGTCKHTLANRHVPLTVFTGQRPWSALPDQGLPPRREMSFTNVEWQFESQVTPQVAKKHKDVKAATWIRLPSCWLGAHCHRQLTWAHHSSVSTNGTRRANPVWQNSLGLNSRLR